MYSLILALLDDPFGVHRDNLKWLLSIVDDEKGERAADRLRKQIEEVTINEHTRFRLRQAPKKKKS